VSWKNSTAVVQIAGDPPTSGKAIFAKIGSMKKSKSA